MKYFDVTLKSVSYLQIEADTPEQAELLAWEQLQSGESYGCKDADWSCEGVYEQFATDETRSYGPRGESNEN